MNTITPVNSQITDAVTQTNVQVVGEAPAQSMGMLYQMSTHAAGLSIQNGTSGQQGLNQVATAVVAASVDKILGSQNSGGASGKKKSSD